MLATGFCFALFGVGGLLLTLIWFPLCNLCYRDVRRRQAVSRATVQKTFAFFVRVMCWVGVIRLELHNADKLRDLRGRIVIANHPSLIDVVVMISLIPDADCVVKGGLWRNPFIGGVIRATGYINNGDVEGLLKDCEHSLTGGSNLIIFPEGTRTMPGNACRFQRGAANIALRSGKDFQLVFLRVTPAFLTKGLPWYKVPSCKVDFIMDVAGQYEIAPYLEQNVTTAVRQLTRDLEKLFNLELEHDRSAQSRA